MLNNPIYKVERDYFTVAALVCATLSLATSCFVFTAILFGCLGILFALLSKRRNGKLTNESKLAIGFSCFGLATGLLFLAVSLPAAWQMLESGEYPEWTSRFNEAFGTVSGNSVSGTAP